MASSLLERAQERRAAAWNRMTDLTDRAEREDRDLTAEERASWDAAEADLTEATADKERYERQATLESEARNAPTPAVVTPEARGGEQDPEKRLDAAFTQFIRGGIEGVDQEHRSLVAARYQSAPELRAEGIATGSAGGYLVPPGFWNNLLIAMKAYGGLLNEVGIIETTTGQPLQWPGADDTANVGAILGENTQVSQQDIVFTTQTLNAYTYTSKLVLVSLQLLQDSAFNVDSFVNGRLAERIARIQATHIVSGSGSGQPQGIVTGVTNTTTLATGATTTLGSGTTGYDSLLDLIHSVDPAYRALPDTKFAAHDSFVKAVRKVKDTQGRPLWQPDYLAGGDRDTILGYPVTIDNSMATMAASSTSALFGNFRRGYIWRRVLGLQMLRLTERYADYLQVGFLGFMRGDGKVQDPKALAALVQSAT